MGAYSDIDAGLHVLARRDAERVQEAVNEANRRKAEVAAKTARCRATARTVCAMSAGAILLAAVQSVALGDLTSVLACGLLLAVLVISRMILL